MELINAPNAKQKALQEEYPQECGIAVNAELNLQAVLTRYKHLVEQNLSEFQNRNNENWKYWKRNEKKEFVFYKIQYRIYLY